MNKNPYIEKIKNHPSILQGDEVYYHKGKWRDFFQNNQEIYLEIGTGLGNFFSQESIKYQEKNFIGMEIKFKRLFKTMEKTSLAGKKNFILLKDFGQNIDKIFEKNEVAKTYIFFPDPWDEKKRQHKHKLMQQDFLKKLFEVTQIGGRFLFKTDHKKYFEETLTLLQQQNLWEEEFISFDYEKESNDFSTKKLTEFESLFRKDKIAICYGVFRKRK